MKPIQIQRLLAPAFTLVLAFTLAGCLFSPDSKTGGDDVEVVEPINAENVLDLLIDSYVAKEIDRYSGLFDTVQYTFRFDRTDVENDPDLDPSWGWPEELTSTKNMFESELVLGITLDFVKGDTEFARESDGEGVSLEWRKVICTEIELEIDTIDPDGGENIIYKVAGDRAMYFFETYPEELIDGQPRWRIVEWRDIRVGP